MTDTDFINLFNVRISNICAPDLLTYIRQKVEEKKKVNITYVNANSFNLLFELKELRFLLSNFDLLHPDGIGVYLASKFLYGKEGLKKRITGSDFYPLLAREAIKNNWSMFFLGDKDYTLNKIIRNYHKLNISGLQNGYNIMDDRVIEKINHSCPDILIVGLGCPKQEEWITKYKDQLNATVILAVGDGIKVFAGTKVRGFRIIRALGLEWFVRLLKNPVKLWKRYIAGIPIFAYRITKYKFSKNVPTSI